MFKKDYRMDNSITANKREGHYQRSHFWLQTPHIVLISYKDWVMGIIQFYGSIYVELFNVIK